MRLSQLRKSLQGLWKTPKCKRLNKAYVAYCDVDDTLVIWPDPGTFTLDETTIDKCLRLDYHGDIRYVMPHYKHIEALKDHAARGHGVVVWSQGGEDWAWMVVKALKLENVVDLVATKPNWYYDDLPVTVWMPEVNRIWKDPVYYKRNLIPTNDKKTVEDLHEDIEI